MPQATRDVVPFEGRFPSWEAFDLARKAHCEKTHTMYVCRNTVKVDVANQRRKLQVPLEWEYDRKVFVCTHGYKRVSRSSGARPRQKVRFTSCNARFTAALVCEFMDGKEVLCIKIVNQHVEHNDHPVSVDQWRNYSQNRAAILDHPYLTHEAELMRRVGSNKRAAKDHIENLSGRVCTMKDMHNLYAKLRRKEDVIKSHVAPSMIAMPSVSIVADAIVVLGGTEAELPVPPHHPVHHSTMPQVEHVLQQFVDAHVENHVSILSADDGSNEAICLASKNMKEHYQVYPELCLLDIAVCHDTSSEMDGNQLYGFMAMDALGNSKPIFLVQIIHPMTTRLLHRICQDFKRTHPRWTDLKLIVMDALLPMVVDVFREEFPTMRVLLCQFHVIKYFSSIVSQVEFGIANVDTQEHVCELLKELVFAHSERYYQDVKGLLRQHLEHRLDHPLFLHLEQHWEPYRRLWVSYWRLRSLEFSSFFSKGFEAFWIPLKGIFERTKHVGNTALAAAAVVGHVLPALPQSATHTPTGGMPVQTTVTVSMVPPSAASVASTMISPTLSAGTVATSPTVMAAQPQALGMAPLVLAGNATHSIAKCMSEVITMIKFIEEEWAAKMLMLEMTRPVTEFSAGSVLHFLVNCMSSFGVGLVSTQLVTANTGVGGNVTIVKGRAAMARMAAGEGGYDTAGLHGEQAVEDPLAAEGTVVYVDKAKKKKHVMRRDCSGCDCEFYEVYQLPCQHLIWYEISYLHHKQLNMSAVGQRWFLRTFQIPKFVSHKESNEIEYHIV